jgi:hypothetical protein
VVGQQFGDVRPPKVTFHGHDRADFENAAEQIVRAFRRFRQFQGLAVDDVDGYMAIWQRDAVVQASEGTSTAAGRAGSQLRRTLGVVPS